MGNRSLKKYLYDVQLSIVSIYEYLGNKRDFFEYENNKQLRRAVERELEIIGEAVNHLLALDETIAIDNARGLLTCVILWFMAMIKLTMSSFGEL